MHCRLGARETFQEVLQRKKASAFAPHQRPMHLEQLNLSYLPTEDRILLRVGLVEGEDKQEVQIHFTRRMVNLMWPAMMEAITAHMRLNRPETAFASEEMLNMDHDEAIQNIAESGNFDRAYDSGNRKIVNGERPFLLETIKFHLQKDAPLWIQFFPEQGGTVDLKLDTDLLHGFCKLLIDAERASGWGLDLVLPKAEEFTKPAHLLN